MPSTANTAASKAGPKQLDTIRNCDVRYKISETDAKLEIVPEYFGQRRIGVAIVGVGRMGAIHLSNVLREPRANVLHVLDIRKDRLDYMSQKYFLKERAISVLHTNDWHRVLEDRQVEAVVISTPTYSHEQYVRSALEHNKHVMCEKPLAESINAVDSLVQLAQARNLKLICAFQRRYDTSFRHIAQQIERGEIGTPRLIKTCCRDSPLPPIEYIKISGGIYHDCFVHDLDVILWYANELPVEVHTYAHAYMADYAELNDFDTTVVCMRFKSGLMSVTDLSRVGPSGYEQRIEVYGPRGVLKLDEMAVAGWEKHTAIGVTRPSQCYSFASRYYEAYQNELTELFNHIEGHKTMHEIRPGYLQTLCKIIHAVELSARSGKAILLEWTKNETTQAIGGMT